jgi:hypothetical protein
VAFSEEEYEESAAKDRVTNRHGVGSLLFKEALKDHTKAI